MSTICHKNAFRGLPRSPSASSPSSLGSLYYLRFNILLFVSPERQRALLGLIRATNSKWEATLKIDRARATTKRCVRLRQSVLQWLSTYNIIITRVSVEIKRPTEGNHLLALLPYCRFIVETFAIDRSSFPIPLDMAFCHSLPDTRLCRLVISFSL